jgi:cytidylate kinase
VIAIDGPAASGKSSTAAAVARALGGHHLDSGALYRGLTRVALDAASEQPGVIRSAAEARGLQLRLEGREIVPYLDGGPAESRIRTADVTAAVSALSAVPALRDWVNQRLRVAATEDRVLVLDGRDIGTAVFPAALLKIFLTATPEARARRRLEQRGDAPSPEAIAAEAALLAARDVADSNRLVAPLRRADDAVVIDTTDLTFEEQVSAIVRRAQAVLS